MMGQVLVVRLVSKIPGPVIAVEQTPSQLSSGIVMGSLCIHSVQTLRAPGLGMNASWKKYPEKPTGTSGATVISKLRSVVCTPCPMVEARCLEVTGKD